MQKQGKAIAAGLLYWHGQTLEIPWASSIRDYNALPQQSHVLGVHSPRAWPGAAPL
jgi:hypothetical protein